MSDSSSIKLQVVAYSTFVSEVLIRWSSLKWKDLYQYEETIFSDGSKVRLEVHAFFNDTIACFKTWDNGRCYRVHLFPSSATVGSYRVDLLDLKAKHTRMLETGSYNTSAKLDALLKKYGMM